MRLSNNRTSAYIFLLLNTALWGSSAPIIKYSFDFTSPALFLFYRFLIASAIFLPIFLIHRSRNRHKINHFQTMLLALLSGPICLMLSFYGLSKTSAIEGSILGSTGPLLTVLLCIVFLKEKVKSKELKGLGLALLGTLIIVLEPLITGHNHVSLSVQGNLLIILGNSIWSVFILFSKKVKTDSIYLSFYSFVMSIPFFYFLTTSQQTSLALNPQALPSIIYMAIGGSVIGFWAYQEGQKRIEASEAVIFTYLNPVFAIPISILWLKEAFSPVAIAATILIIVGVFISEKR
jgi:drug/metabolite transporter (DMT)-like permease